MDAQLIRAALGKTIDSPALPYDEPGLDLDDSPPLKFTAGYAAMRQVQFLNERTIRLERHDDGSFDLVFRHGCETLRASGWNLEACAEDAMATAGVL
jgi:hypothetical protein